MYLGIDVGTSSLKTVLADDHGKIIAVESVSYDLIIPQENWSEQDPDDWYMAAVTTIKNLSKRNDLSKVKGVSFSGQMHGLVILDDQDKVIRPALLWNDNRTIAECAYLNNVIGKTNLIKWTGNIAITGFTAPKVLWIKHHEHANFARINKIMLPKDYVAYKMSGCFASDVSDSSGTLYFDVEHKRWSEPMLKVLGITNNQLPKVYESYEVIGNVSDEFAKLTGMSTNTKVIIGGGDQAVGAVGTGTVSKNMLSISLGTSGVVFASGDKFSKISSGAMHSFCHANGKYHIMGVMLSAAGSFDWWANDIIRTKHYEDVNKEIMAVEAHNLYFLPYLTGERSPINDPDARGAFVGLTLSHKRGDLSRAVIEGVNFGLLDCLNSINKLGLKPKEARIIGGGSKSKVWLKILADTLGINLHTINTAEGGALGAIILAMVGCKQYKTVADACRKIVKVDESYKFNKMEHERYLIKFNKFKKIYHALKPL